MLSNVDKFKVLQKKSKENYMCALLAHKRKFNNSAISRFYYSCLLLAKGCAYHKGWVTDSDFDDHRSSTHNLIQKNFIERQLQEPTLELVDLTRLSYFGGIKSARIEAEYSYDKDYTTKQLQSQYDSCRFNAKRFIEAIENIYHLSIIEE